MTNFETALQSLVGREVHVRLLVTATGPVDDRTSDLTLTVQEVMPDSFVGEQDGTTTYVPFHAIAFVSAPSED
ncbi:MAG: hypothetical protein ACYTGZ_11650 [Planctomycetota bacterium]|jgi:hypothetical protein